MFKATKLCPEAVIIPPNMEKYSRVSREIRAIFNELTPEIEPISIDEAFLDLTGTENLHQMNAAKLLNKTATEIFDKIGITVSIGLSHNKFLAKIASDMNKPQGFSIIGKDETKSFLAALPINKIWGVGQVLNRKLNKNGITLIGQLQKMDLKKLIRDYGKMGERLYYFSRGEDSRVISSVRTIKSISNETTLNKDVSGFQEILKIMWPLCEKVSARLKQENIAGKTINLKLKTINFKIISRAVTLHDATQMAEIIYEKAKIILAPECNGNEYRLIGISMSNLIDAEFADLPELIDQQKQRKIKTEKAMDKIREKFGSDIINKGRKFT